MAFPAPYDDCGRRAASSGTMAGSVPPNTAMVLAKTRRGARGRRRHASRRLRVASTLTCMPASNSASDCPLSTAARWYTTATSGSTTETTKSTSAIVPWRWAMRRSSMRDRVTSAATMREMGGRPIGSASSAWIRRLPRNPDAPVTRTFIVHIPGLPPRAVRCDRSPPVAWRSSSMSSGAGPDTLSPVRVLPGHVTVRRVEHTRQVALVTGAGSGIGRAVALGLLRRRVRGRARRPAVGCARGHAARGGIARARARSPCPPTSPVRTP